MTRQTIAVAAVAAVAVTLASIAGGADGALVARRGLYVLAWAVGAWIAGRGAVYLTAGTRAENVGAALALSVLGAQVIGCAALVWRCWP